ncbi:RnfH family protein [Halomonas sp. NO4]|uniref:RnfH family protein n=1 Tax=Halomonas sp. NO4 TaxID=2484813 RepID=UPI0013CF6684|nr:RnfH family protein [Halomonas sp. NO4]
MAANPDSRGQEATLRVEVAFALPEKQRLVTLEVPAGTTARQAVDRAGLAALFPEVAPETFSQPDLGIFGRRLPEPGSHRLRDGDRIEAYRPLTIDPKAARAARAARRG